MKKQILHTYGGKNAKVADILVNRLLPGSGVVSVGPFVFLDHIYPAMLPPQPSASVSKKSTHPHRGIATFSYMLAGGLEHFDSQGNHGIIETGGAQWMKAGNGILHDEHRSPAFRQQGGMFHGMQFWINLPAKNKAEAPEYKAVSAAEIPETELPNEAGVLKVVIGMCGVEQSPVKTYTRQFLYHIRLNPKSGFTLPTKADLQYAAFIPAEEVKVNGVVTSNSELLIFTQDNNDIELYNPGINPANVIVFGGEPYTEPMVMEGPFVMNTRAEIAQAYADFHEGKYGIVNY